MQFVAKISVALLAALAAVGEAHDLRHGHHQFHARNYNASTPAVSVSSVWIIPTPLEPSAPAVTPSSAASSSVATSVSLVTSAPLPATSGAATSGAPSDVTSIVSSGATTTSVSTELTPITEVLSYTVTAGTSTSVVTTTIHKTSTRTVTYTQVGSIGQSLDLGQSNIKLTSFLDSGTQRSCYFHHHLHSGICSQCYLDLNLQHRSLRW